VIGHSQGGLITFEWWRRHWLKWGDNYHAGYTHTHVARLFSLDSPINGVCATSACLGPPGYPDYGLRDEKYRPPNNALNPAYDPYLLQLDQRAGEPFRFIGTEGDHIPVKGPSVGPVGVTVDAYGPPGPENLQHQLLFAYGSYGSCEENRVFDPEACPAPAPPNHVSDCPIDSQSPQWVQDDAHFIEKFCPGNVAYFNRTLGLHY
jgi:hypothetical protein